MQSAPGRRGFLRRLSGAAHLPDFPENVRRVREAAVQAQHGHPRGVRLGGHEHPQRRGARGEIQGDPRKARRTGRYAREDLPRRRQQDRKRRHPLPRRADDRSGAVGLHVLRREGRDLRRAFTEKRGGYQERRGTVLHAPSADPGHGRVRPAGADENHRGKQDSKFDTN